MTEPTTILASDFDKKLAAKPARPAWPTEFCGEGGTLPPGPWYNYFCWHVGERTPDGTEIGMVSCFLFDRLDIDVELISVEGERKLKRDITKDELDLVNNFTKWGLPAKDGTWRRLIRKALGTVDRAAMNWEEVHDQWWYFTARIVDADAPDNDLDDVEELGSMKIRMRNDLRRMAAEYQAAAVWLLEMANKHGEKLVVSVVADN